MLDYFQLIGLKWSETRSEILQQALKDKRYEWSKRKIFNADAARNLSMYEEIKRTLLNEDQRREHARECEELERKRRNQLTKQLENAVRLQAGGQKQLTLKQFQYLVGEFSADLVEKDIRDAADRQGLSIGTASAAPHINAVEYLDGVTFQGTVQILQELKIDDLYAFLEGSEHTNLVDLMRRSRDAMKEWRHRPVDRQRTLNEELLGKCLIIFKDGQQRKRYDNSLRRHKLHTLLEDDIRFAQDAETGRFIPESRRSLLEKSEQAGFERDFVEKFLDAWERPKVSPEDQTKIDCLAKAVRQAIAKDELKNAGQRVDEIRHINSKVPEIEELQQRIEARRDLREHILHLESVLKNDNNERDIVEAWSKLQSRERHAAVEGWRDRIRMAEERVKLHDAAANRLAEQPSEHRDRELIRLVRDPKRLDSNDPGIVHLKVEVDEARKREAQIMRLQTAVSTADSTTGVEDQIVKCADVLPAGYEYALQPRVALAMALAVPEDNDDRIAAAWEQFQKSTLRLRNPDTLERCRQALRRQDGTATIRKLTHGLCETDDRAIVAAWDRAELEAARAPRDVVQLWLTANRNVQVLDKLQSDLRLLDDGELSETDFARTADGLPAEYRFELIDRVALARELAQPKPREARLADLWNAVEGTAAEPRLRPTATQCRLAARRGKALDELHRLPAEISEDVDRKLTALWKSAELHASPQAAPFAERARMASERVDCLDKIEKIAAKVNLGMCPESDLAAAAEGLPSDYPYGLSHRVQLACALAADPLSDLAVAGAWDRVQRTDDAPQTDAVLAVCRRALERCAAMARFRAIPEDLPLDETDQRWIALPIESLNQCHDAQGIVQRRAVAAKRYSAWKKLTSALVHDRYDKVRIQRLATDPSLRAYPPLEEIRDEIDAIIESAAALDALVSALEDDDHEAFNASFDPDLVREHIDAFSAHYDALRRFGAAWVDSQLSFHAESPHWQEYDVRIPFSCQPLEMVERFLVATDSQRFPVAADDETLPSTRNDIHEMGGAIVERPAPGESLYVSIWPEIKLHDKLRLVGSAHHVGPLTVPAVVEPDAQPRPWYKKIF